MDIFLRECGLQIFPQKFLKIERLFSKLWIQFLFWVQFLEK